MKTSDKKSSMSISNKKKIKVFLFILVLTSIIWLLVELSKTYTSSTVFEVQYTNIPSKKLLQNTSKLDITVTLKAPGFSLLKYKIKKQLLYLNLNNVIKSSSNYYVLPNNQLAYLNEQLSSETEVISVLNDTIFVELGTNKSKKVPINPSLDIKFKLGYNLIDKLKIKPDSILITGPEKYVDSIKEVTTEVLKIKDVYKDISLTLLVNQPAKNTNLTFSENKVTILGKVDKFTEGSFTIPVTLINTDEGVVVSTFPKEIEVVYKAGLSNFNKITKNSFLIVYDFEQYKKDTLIKYLTPTIEQKSAFISTLKINPSQIEFLIQK